MPAQDEYRTLPLRELWDLYLEDTPCPTEENR